MNFIKLERAKEITTHWHGGQWSALYQFGSSGVYDTKNALRYLHEVQYGCIDYCEYALHPFTHTQKDLRELNSLLQFFLRSAELNGIGIVWHDHPQYGYKVPFIYGHCEFEITPLRLAF